MLVKLCPTGGLPESTTVKCIDDNTLRINGEDYVFPPDVHEFDQCHPILSARRDEAGELWVTIHVLYSDANREVWETQDADGKYRGQDWEVWTTGQTIYPEEVPHAGNDGQDQGAA